MNIWNITISTFQSFMDTLCPYIIIRLIISIITQERVYLIHIQRVANIYIIGIPLFMIYPNFINYLLFYQFQIDRTKIENLNMTLYTSYLTYIFEFDRLFI